ATDAIRTAAVSTAVAAAVWTVGAFCATASLRCVAAHIAALRTDLLPCVRLPGLVRSRVATRRAAVFACCGAIRIRRAAAMLRIVLPLSGTPASIRIYLVAVSVEVIVAIEIVIAVEIIVHINVDVVVAPAATPSPTAAPHRTHRNPDTK